jgi:HK97 family phage portal protein
MKIKSTLTNWLSKATTALSPTNRQSEPTTQKSITPEEWLCGTDFPGPARLTAPLEQSAWLYRAATVIVEQVANIPFLFSRGERGRETLITSGPLIDFYNQPAPRLNRFQYWELRVLWLLLRGESFRVPIFVDNPEYLRQREREAEMEKARQEAAARGLPTPKEQLPELKGASGAEKFLREFHRILREPPQKYIPRKKLGAIAFLDPDFMHHIIQDHHLAGWRYNGPRDGLLESQVFLPDEIWHDRLPNPFDNWRGLAPLRAADLAARTDFASANYMRGIIENNAENGFIVRTDQQLTDEQREQMKSSLRNRKRGAGCADQTVLLWGATEIIQPKLTSADLQFLENRKFARGEICAALGVPEEIVATTDHNKYDVMQGARLNFIENRIAPLCARLEAEEQRTIQAIDPRAVGWFDLDSLPIMQKARRDRLAAAKIAIDMGVPFNEVNRVLDLGFKPLPDGDEPHASNANGSAKHTTVGTA